MEGTKLSIEFDVPNWKHGKYAFVFNLGIDGEWAGRSCFKLIDERLLETHSSLCDEFHGQGFGILMYSHGIRYALSEGYRVCSSLRPDADDVVGGSYMSYAALRLWESKRLREQFEVVEESDRFWVKGVL
jgi:hypothetical protein